MIMGLNLKIRGLMSFLNSLGGAVSHVGTALHLPEFGLSEALGYQTPSQFMNDHFNGDLQPRKVANDAGTTSSGTATPYYASGGYSAGSGTATPNYTSLINDQLGRLDGQQQTGLDNIGRSYQSAFDSLTNQKGRAQQQYDTTKTQTVQDNQTAKDNIATGVRNGITGLQRLLGAHGAGNSSAAQVLAPYAAGFQGNQQRQQVQTAYGRNMGALDSSWNNTLQDFDNSFGSLSTDKGNRENALRAQMLQTQANLMGQKANPDLNAINSLGQQIDALGAVQSFDPGVHNYAAPDLAKYNYDASQGAQVAPQDGAESDVGPFTQLLGKKKIAGALA